MNAIPADDGLSRRTFLTLGALAPFGLMLGCRSTATEQSEVDTIIDGIDHVAASDPAMPGMQSLLAFRKERLADGFTDADQAILAGALYLEMQKRLQQTPVNAGNATPRRRVTEADVRTVLAKPLDTAGFDHSYFVNLLSETKARLANDSQFANTLGNAQANALRKTCLTDHTPRWICIGMGVVVVIAFILVL